VPTFAHTDSHAALIIGLPTTIQAAGTSGNQMIQIGLLASLPGGGPRLPQLRRYFGAQPHRIHQRARSLKKLDIAQPEIALNVVIRTVGRISG
jgi:hypothetical protein